MLFNLLNGISIQNFHVLSLRKLSEEEKKVSRQKCLWSLGKKFLLQFVFVGFDLFASHAFFKYLWNLFERPIAVLQNLKYVANVKLILIFAFFQNFVAKTFYYFRTPKFQPMASNMHRLILSGQECQGSLSTKYFVAQFCKYHTLSSIAH